MKDGDSCPSRASLEAQLTRVLDSSVFAGSERLRRFVRYTVEATIGGRADRIKEYVLGTEVFDRGEDYDPRIDPIVRVEAGRLRSKLDEYYAGAGRADPIRIRFPKGSYVPTFEAGASFESASGTEPRRRATVLVAGSVLAVVVVLAVLGIWWRGVDLAPTAPTGTGAPASPPASPLALAVLPLEGYGPEGSRALPADAVTEALITELSKIGGLEVRSRTTVMRYKGLSAPIAEIARELDVSAIVEGGVIGSGEEVHLKIRLVDTARDVKLWAASYRSSAEEIVALQKEVAAAIWNALSEGG